jgi:predicted alpha/beta hydrolase family esterase
VIVPGLHGSGAEHWQSWLHAQVVGPVRVEQDFWGVHDIERWADRIAETSGALGAGPHVVVAHSFGCLAALHATARYPELGVDRILLVAPAEPTRFNVANLLPQARLAMPSCLVASDNRHCDPCLQDSRPDPESDPESRHRSDHAGMKLQASNQTALGSNFPADRRRAKYLWATARA